VRSVPVVCKLLILSAAVGLGSNENSAFGLPAGDPVELRAGIYVAGSSAALPLPVIGYDLYVVGEIHGSNEVGTFFLGYLKRLHESVALRDVALEGSPVFERGFDEYVAGLVPALPEVWYQQLATPDTIKLLQEIRASNETLPGAERIRVHLVDLDFGYELIHRHVSTVWEKLGAESTAVEIPTLAELETLSEEQLHSLIDRLEALAVNETYIFDELQGLRDSIRFRFVRGAVERWELAANECTAIRDHAVAQNVRRLLGRLSGAPVLVLFGGAHVQKAPLITGIVVGPRVITIDEPYWVERLAEDDVAIYSLLIDALSGSIAAHGRNFNVGVNSDQLRFPDGQTLADVTGNVADDSIIYLDLQDNVLASAHFGPYYSAQLGRFDPTIPAGEAFDGLILFKRLTPAD
jgi:hypothetical protein